MLSDKSVAALAGPSIAARRLRELQSRPDYVAPPATPRPAPPPEPPRPYWQHGRELAPAPAVSSRERAPRRVQSPVLQLLANGKIGNAERAAADRWLRDYELASGAREQPDPLYVPTTPPVGGHDRTLVATVDALSRSRDAANAVGAAGQATLVAAVAMGQSLTALASAHAADAARRAEDAARAEARFRGARALAAFEATLLATAEEVAKASAKAETQKDRKKVVRLVTDVREVSGRLVAVLQRLTEHYQTVDDARSRKRTYADHVPAIDRARGRRQGETPTQTVDAVSWDGRRARHSPVAETAAH